MNPRRPTSLLARLAGLAAAATLVASLAIPPAHAQAPADGGAVQSAPTGSGPAPAGSDRGLGYTPSRIEPMPRELQGVGVDEKLKALLPLDANLYDENGNSVELRKYFGTGRPVILQLGYFGCPKLCDEVARGTVDSLREVDLNLGDDFTVLYVSIDPNEKPELARSVERGYIERYTVGTPRDPRAAQRGWHFLTGADREIRRIADTVGYRYKWVESAQQYSHPAVLIIITADGVVSRYLYGVQFDPKVVRLSLVDASAGKVGSIMDQIIMLCFHFDPNTGQYSVAAMRLMRIAGAFSVLLLMGAVGLMILRGRQIRSAGDPPKPKRGLAAVLARGSSPPPPPVTS